MSYILHIHSWPGAGKRTIAHRLAAQLGARLLDNHVLLNPAEALFERGDPRHGSLRRDVRRVVFEHAARLDPTMGVVATDALSTDPADARLFADVVALAEARRVRFIPVVLDLALDENVIRLSNLSRSEHRKLTNPDVLRRLRNDHVLLQAPGAITLDVTTMTADQAAAVIRQKAVL